METLEVTAVPDGEEHATTCSCCGRPVYEGCGELQSQDSLIADYWYRWSEGHEGRFTLAVGLYDQHGERLGQVAVLSTRIADGNIIYTVLEPADSPWTDFGPFGSVLSREQALALPNLFNVVDAISANESRVSARILASGLRA